MKHATMPESHWDRYYSGGSAPAVPSQFAAFAAMEADKAGAVIELGCGNGRDALFFARQGKRVAGVDASQSAIEACRRAAEAQQVPATFMCSRVEDPRCLEEALFALGSYEGELLLYARFFLHAVDEDTERALLRHAAQALRSHKGVLAVEFRTDRDRQQAKATPDHYRRFIEPPAFVNRVQDAGLVVRYFVEGFGMAKYRQDDAHVARFLLAPA